MKVADCSPWHGQWCCRWWGLCLWPKESLQSLFLPAPPNKACPNYWEPPPSQPCLTDIFRKNYILKNIYKNISPVPILSRDYAKRGNIIYSLHLSCCTLALPAYSCCLGNVCRWMGEENHIRFNRLAMLLAGWREAVVWVDCRSSLYSLSSLEQCQYSSLWGRLRANAKKNIYVWNALEGSLVVWSWLWLHWKAELVYLPMWGSTNS